ncbi:MAG: purine-nucleoside phosphorylase [Pseudomonadota bacterium]
MSHQGQRFHTLRVPIFDQLGVAASVIRAKIGASDPTVGVVLGSGLGAFADRLVDRTAIEYRDLPHFPVSKVAGHSGRLVVGTLGGTKCAVMQGRAHFYEGYDLKTITFPISTLVLLGCRYLVITNSAGAVNPHLKPAELVLIKDHLSFFPDSPLRGEYDERLGPQFVDMTQAYAPELRELAQHIAVRLFGSRLREGVYAGMPGPAYETPAEVRMLRILGADLCGMSTVPEVIAANRAGARVLGVSCVSNLGSGYSGTALSHEEVTAMAAKAQPYFVALLEKVVAAIGNREAP